MAQIHTYVHILGLVKFVIVVYKKGGFYYALGTDPSQRLVIGGLCRSAREAMSKAEAKCLRHARRLFPDRPNGPDDPASSQGLTGS